MSILLSFQACYQKRHTVSDFLNLALYTQHKTIEIHPGHCVYCMYLSFPVDLLKDMCVVGRFWQGPGIAGTWGAFASSHWTLHFAPWYIFGQLSVEGHGHRPSFLSYCLAVRLATT